MSVRLGIRVAGEADAPVLAELHAKSFADKWGQGSLATLLSRPQVLGLKAMVNDVQVAGFILIQVIADEAEILTICVDPQARRGGVGRLLLAESCRQLRARGAVNVFLEVSESNAGARLLYEQSGFLEVGRRKGYYRDNRSADGGHDALLMKKLLAA